MSDRPRRILLFEPLPEYETAAERIRNNERDVRAAAELVRVRLEAAAAKWISLGWVADPDIELGIANRMMSGEMRLTRDD